jgi:galactokinase
MNVSNEIEAEFCRVFDHLSVISQAPGRVNLIGEHTDYNQGYVLPAAINLKCWAATSARNDRNLLVYSANADERVVIDLDNPRRLDSWADYPAGIAAEIERLGIRLPGANLYIRGDVPLGSGLSSSAAIEVSTAYVLTKLINFRLSLTDIAKLCQRAENRFVGANCGIMDQFAACHGLEGKALFLDCRSLEFRPVSVPSHIRLVVCNTMIKHELNQGEYNFRRMQCEEGVQKLSSVLPGIRALRDVSLTGLEQNKGLLTEILYRRCKHVISENDRVIRMVQALEDWDATAMFQLMKDSHRSLRDDYEVSCKELDLMVSLANQLDGVIGSRMMGGGFGGCTVNLVDVAAAAEFRHKISESYFSATGLRPEVYICLPSDGAGIVKIEDDASQNALG